jgi:putative NADH-flavin reductase
LTTRTIRLTIASNSGAKLIPIMIRLTAVLSGLGASSIAEAGIAAQGTRAIIDAMNATGVRRIVVVSAAPVATVPSPGRPNPPKHDPGEGFFMRYVLAPLTRVFLRKVYADHALMEDALRDSNLDWTVFRPPRLTNKPLTGKYRTALGRNLRGGLLISRADVAHAMLASLREPETIRQTVGIAY